MQFIWFILIGIVAGWLAGQVMKGGGFGLIGDLVVGILGALLGGWLFGLAGVSAGGGLIGQLVVATIGAIVLLLLLRLIKRARGCVGIRFRGAVFGGGRLAEGIGGPALAVAASIILAGAAG